MDKPVWGGLIFNVIIMLDGRVVDNYNMKESTKDLETTILYVEKHIKIKGYRDFGEVVYIVRNINNDKEVAVKTLEEIDN